LKPTQAQLKPAQASPNLEPTEPTEPTEPIGPIWRDFAPIGARFRIDRSAKRRWVLKRELALPINHAITASLS
jgi:hypothetical protein